MRIVDTKGIGIMRRSIGRRSDVIGNKSINSNFIPIPSLKRMI